MRMMGRILILAGVLILGAVEQSQACTAFSMLTGAGWLTGRNYDWDTESAWLLVNRRGTMRAGWLQGDPGPAAIWKARYGSLSVNQYGNGFPCSGMNEAGLSVDVLWLEETGYPKADKKPSLSELQWVQYVLDQAATVDEALAIGTAVRITRSSSPLHFYLADRLGNRAVLEYVAGEAVVSRPQEAEPFGITNSVWQASEAFRQQQGSAFPLKSDGSVERYCRALGFASQTRGMALDTATAVTAVYSILNSVATERTVWQLVYEAQRGRFWYKTAHAPAVKYLDLAQLDFSARGNIEGLPLVLPQAGSTRAELRRYEPVDNLTQVTLALKELGDKQYATEAAVQALSTFQMTAPALMPEQKRKPAGKR